MPQLYVGLDIGSETHKVEVLTEKHEVVNRRTVKHSIREISGFIEELLRLKQQHGCSDVMVGMESSNGYAAPLDRMLVNAGLTVIGINSFTINKYREVVGQPRKDDSYDAGLIASYLIDLYHLKGMQDSAQEIKNPEQASLGKLRALTRHYRTTKRELVRVSNRLRKHLLGYFPDFLEEFSDLQTKTARMLLRHFNTVSKVKKVKVSSIAKLKISSRRTIGPKAASKLKALVKEINYFDPIEDQMGKVTHDLVCQMNWLIDQLDELEIQITKIAQEREEIQKLASEIPGAGFITASELLAEIGDIKRFSTRDKLSIYCGIGCLNYCSGKSEKSRKPTRINHRAKSAICMMAQAAMVNHEESGKYYKKKRQEGKSHWHAIKCLAKYLLRLVYAKLNQMEAYDVIYMAA